MRKKGFKSSVILHIVIQTCEPPLLLWLKASCPVQGYSSSIRHSRKQRNAASNINPASFISHTTRKLKDLSLALLLFLSLSPEHMHLFLFLLVTILTYTKARERTHRCAVFVLFHPQWRPECTITKRLNQEQYDSVYSSMQQII